ncbi:17594_t:CDS:2 [Funneliformis geosporum]|uniref:12080_t:CDS:1 n=1 Tax=Funneliformis geosporum TaxID=1117311 RepID=A0A9W4SH37_9GLOM|nr:12080_t:CDS:2 [Funneliformis geosporum]CAI2170909.1 17594_t:CDS:2 [Funneliformis geosporum]
MSVSEGGAHPSGDDDVEDFKEQDRFLPIANVARIMKRALPENAKIAKEAKECVQDDRCQQEKRKTINGEDILWAMQSLGFENYAEALKIYLAKYREPPQHASYYPVINNVTPRVSPFVRTFSATAQCHRLKIPLKTIDPKVKVPDDPYELSKLINKFSEQDRFEDVLSIVWNTKKSAQSVVVWNHLIHHSVKKGKLKLAIRLLNEMKKRSFVPNEHTYTILLNEIFNEFISKGKWLPNQESFTIMINACARQGSDGYDIALKLWNQFDVNSIEYQKMVDRDLEWNLVKRPSDVTIDDHLVRSMLLVCRKSHHYEKAFEIIGNYYDLRSDDDRLCIDGKQYERGIKLFYQALNRFPDLPLDIYNFNKLIFMCNQSKQFEKAISTIKSIQKRDLNLTPETYDLLMISCRMNENWSMAKLLYNDIMKFKKKLAFDLRILTKVLELAEIKWIDDNSLIETRWLLISLHKIGLQDIITSIEKEKNFELYNNNLLGQIMNAYKLSLDDKDLTDQQKVLWKRNLKILKDYFERKQISNRMRSTITYINTPRGVKRFETLIGDS